MPSRHHNQSILKKIAQINQELFDLNTCGDNCGAIRAFLSDPKTINTLPSSCGGICRPNTLSC